MAELLPINFQLLGETALANYDYDKIAEGYGYTTYYLFQAADSGGTSYQISKELNYSNAIAIQYYNAGFSNDTITFYSAAFNLPRIVKGTALVNFCVGCIQGAVSQTAVFSIKLYHYDGSTSTQLGSTWTSQTVSLTSSDQIVPMNAVIPITTAKRFKSGDKIKIEVLTTCDVSSGGGVEYGIDPQNRDSNTVKGSALPIITPSTDNSAFTQFIARIPFKLNT